MPFLQHAEIRITKLVQQTENYVLVHIGLCYPRIFSSGQRKTRSSSAWTGFAGSGIASQRSDGHDN